MASKFKRRLSDHQSGGRAGRCKTLPCANAGGGRTFPGRTFINLICGFLRKLACTTTAPYWGFYLTARNKMGIRPA
ncbi:hypothetical protein KCP71_14180 [Salmonella enterica subsp. enterica]|nr:hypothetical protein KCP71_14180 [Salmonella enterica subsp. enterica]